eukprot:g5178.t1
MVVVGDDNQAIYGFTGADHASIDKFMETCVDFEVIQQYLTICFRCPRKVIKLANEMLEARPQQDPGAGASVGGTDGSGVVLMQARANAPAGAVARNVTFVSHPLPKRAGETVVLCRYNWPLVYLLYAFAKRGQTCQMRGRSALAKGLKDFLGSTNPYWQSWGSSQPIRDPNGTYHLFATTILNGCNINNYPYNEELVHAVSPTLLGPYSYRNVALSTTIINPHVVRVPPAARSGGADGDEYVLFYSGEPLPARYHKNCSQARAGGAARRGGLAEPPGPPGYTNIGCVLSIATTASLQRPFAVRLANFTPIGAGGLFCRTNPTGYIFPNGTTLLFFRSAGSQGENEQIWLARAPHYLGPYALVTPAVPVFPNHNEDPFVFRNARGRFLLMLHQSHWGPGPNGAKAYSYDGLTWHYSDESMTDVWSSTIDIADGSSVAFQRREEPKIYVDESGHMRAMFNAVADDSGGTYVMSQAIVGP